MGPNLRGIVGRRAGELSGFAYSAALRGSGLTWKRKELDEYLGNPAAKVPGNLMAYSGMTDASDRAIVIDYLERLQ